MKIELSYIYYSLVDTQHQFGLVTEVEDPYHDEDYIRWVWYHLGAILGSHTQFILHPLSVKYLGDKGKILRSYMDCNDAEKQARQIANKIFKTIK